jgi:hypothetical protein
MKVYTFKQRSDEWYKAKLGIPTASQFHNILTPTGAPTKGDRRNKYKFKLVAERLLKQSMDDHYEDYWIKRGRELEPQARTAFIAQHRGLDGIDEVGFITTDDGKIGASPDGFLRINGRRSREALEIKCPSPWVMVEYLLEGLESNYMPQVQGQILVGGLKVMHLFCYHPNMPAVHIPTQRDDDYIAKLARALFDFCNELDAETDRAQRRGPYKLAELLRLSAEMRSIDIPGTFPWLT